MKKIIILMFLFSSVPSYSQDKIAKEFMKYTVNSVSVQGVYIKNLSDYKNIFPNSYGGYITYSKLFKSKFSFDVRAGVLKQTTTDSTKDFSSITFPLHIGGRYYFTQTKIKPYISFMNGINIISEDVKANNVLDTNSGLVVRYAFQFGTGVKFFFTKDLFFDVNANYNNNFYRHDAMLTGWEYNGGFGYVL